MERERENEKERKRKREREREGERCRAIKRHNNRDTTGRKELFNIWKQIENIINLGPCQF